MWVFSPGCGPVAVTVMVVPPDHDDHSRHEERGFTSVTLPGLLPLFQEIFYGALGADRLSKLDLLR